MMTQTLILLMQSPPFISVSSLFISLLSAHFLPPIRRMDPNLNLILQSILSSPTSSSVVDPYPSSTDPMFSGMNLQSLLNLNPSLLLSDYPALSFLTDHPPLQSPKPPLLIPKTEDPPQPQQQYLTTPPHSHPQPQQPFNFFFPKRPRLDHHYSSTTWQQFPSTTTTSSYSSPDTSSSSSSSPSSFRKQPPSSSSSCVIPQSNLARQRRLKLSEKTRCLQKLMPWDKKMDQATLLEEAYKYVKFLQAQVTVLNTMPQTSSSRNNNNDGNRGGVVFGELERLSRNQVLQVLVNSPVAQTVMSSQGLCVFSLEQFGMLRKMSERSLLFQHMNDMNNMMNIVSDDSKPNFFN